MSLPWFKHYNTAHEGFTLRTLWDEEEFEAYGLFWILLELVSRFEEEKWSGKLKIPMSSLQRITGWNYQRLTRVLTKIGETSSEVQGIQVRVNLDQSCELFVPKWLELQETRGGKRLAKIEQNVGRSKKEEVRSKKEDRETVSQAPAPSTSYPSEFSELSQEMKRLKISNEMVNNWLSTYGNANKIIFELKKAMTWIEANKNRKPKNFQRFFTNWLARDLGSEKPKRQSAPVENLLDVE